MSPQVVLRRSPLTHYSLLPPDTLLLSIAHTDAIAMIGLYPIHSDLSLFRREALNLTPQR
ncbi:hypothetical protein GXM_01288 [Nostoc sphaeroides CCNUC1]|uniref:Uncharacterized protein n=1 Tax=Nostoc sphaeroides CCNUC1 TaxID=2653204 RepID=A0A5P8VTP9_9NOSO|nr:hypothetical protein GXM_01288 [Nostoc sphaeroides CCNUC1]